MSHKVARALATTFERALAPQRKEPLTGMGILGIDLFVAALFREGTTPSVGTVTSCSWHVFFPLVQDGRGAREDRPACQVCWGT